MKKASSPQLMCPGPKILEKDESLIPRVTFSPVVSHINDISYDKASSDNINDTNESLKAEKRNTLHPFRMKSIERMPLISSKSPMRKLQTFIPRNKSTVPGSKQRLLEIDIPSSSPNQAKINIHSANIRRLSKAFTFQSKVPKKLLRKMKKVNPFKQMRKIKSSYKSLTGKLNDYKMDSTLYNEKEEPPFPFGFMLRSKIFEKNIFANEDMDLLHRHSLYGLEDENNKQTMHTVRNNRQDEDSIEKGLNLNPGTQKLMYKGSKITLK